MEIEDLAKKIEWLEKEHRKDRAMIGDLQEKLVSYEGNFSLIQTQMKELDANLSRFSSTTARLDQFDKMVTQYRAEVTKAIDDVEKRRSKHERDVEDRRRIEIEVINKSLIEVRGSIDALQDLRRGLQGRVDEDVRLARVIHELEKKLDDFTRTDDDIRRNIRSSDEAHRNDMKRITESLGDLAALRKRAEEAREKADLSFDTMRQLDNRINELLSSESDRRQAQISFIEQQSMAQVDRDHAWKDIQTRFETYSRQTTNLDQQILAMEEAQRAVKRSQEAFDDISLRMERRINEITEVQRLAEDRFRQEWVTFKADDQKRWTNYTLTQDEVGKNIRAELDKLNQRIATLDDISQSLQDLVQQTSEATETQLQELMNWAHEFLTNYERIMGRARPTR